MRTSATFLIRACSLMVLIGAAQWITAQTGVNVTTAQQDIGVPDICPNCVYRTGENLDETSLTYDALSTTTFGKLCEYDNLDGQVYGQPLVVTNVKWQGSGSPITVIYVVTMNGKVYAFNGIIRGQTGRTPVFRAASGDRGQA